MRERPLFTVVMAPACLSCAGALEVTERVGRELGVVVRVIEVDDPRWSPPSGFVGTPMVFLADSVVSYGTPTPEQLHAALVEMAAAAEGAP